MIRVTKWNGTKTNDESLADIKTKAFWSLV